MTDLTIAQIAGKLTEAEREIVLGPPDATMPVSAAMKLSLELRLLRPCLKDPAKPADIDNLTMGWTPLGLAVRAYLTENADG